MLLTNDYAKESTRSLIKLLYVYWTRIMRRILNVDYKEVIGLGTDWVGSGSGQLQNY